MRCAVVAEATEREKVCRADRKGTEKCAKAERGAGGSVEKRFFVGSEERPTHFIYIRDSSGSAAERSGAQRSAAERSGAAQSSDDGLQCGAGVWFAYSYF